MTEPMPIYPNQLKDIASRLDGINKMYAAQQTGEIYLDFPDSFAVRMEGEVLMGTFQFDDCETWIFHPCTTEESEQDEKVRNNRTAPPTPPMF